MSLCSYSYPLGTDPLNKFPRVWSLGQRRGFFATANTTTEVDFSWQTPLQKEIPIFIPCNSMRLSIIPHPSYFGFLSDFLTLSNMMGEERWIIFIFNSTFNYWWGKTRFNMYWQFVQCIFYFVICLFVFISQFFYWILAFLLLVYKLSLSLSFSFCAN